MDEEFDHWNDKEAQLQETNRMNELKEEKNKEKRRILKFNDQHNKENVRNYYFNDPNNHPLKHLANGNE
jgi:hypothetical protein